MSTHIWRGEINCLCCNFFLQLLNMTKRVEDSKSNLKVLIIDDDTVFLSSLSALLSAERFSVRGVYTGNDGVSEIKKWKPDLVILDLMLPDEDGLSILSKIREDKDTKDTAVVVCTNRGSEEDEKKCYSLGTKEVLKKANYRIDQLVEKIKEEA